MRFGPLAAALLAFLGDGCTPAGPAASRRATIPGGARVGVEPIPAVHLIENHSSSLIAWRRAGVTNRILVHMDGHSDVDWLPDASVARMAAADPDELASFELHPYAMDGATHRRFAIWNFVYPAARLGVVREFIWVVPDGTLSGPAAAGALVRELILGKIQSISIEESKTLRLENGTVRGTVLGIPWTVCELKDLRDPGEPVLLDIDLDFLTTRSATTQEVTPGPWIEPGQVVARLREAGVRADIATLSLSTMGGYLPPACRWLGPAMVASLKCLPEATDPRWARRAQADRLIAEGHDDEAIGIERELTTAHPEDGATWYDLSRALERAGRGAEAGQARSRGIAADPLLAHAALFEADGAYLNRDYAGALDLYRAYRRAFPDGPFSAYGLRREAGCLSRTGHDEAAIATFKKVLSASPEHADTHLDLGLLLRDRGDFDGAIAQFRAARAILPDLAAYAMALGTSYARGGRIDDAVAELEAAVARRPTWAPAQANLGLLLVQAGRKEDAAAHLNAAAMLAPGDADVMRLLAQLRRQGITAGALATNPE